MISAIFWCFTQHRMVVY